jgi:hypothetical protein
MASSAVLRLAAAKTTGLPWARTWAGATSAKPITKAMAHRSEKRNCLRRMTTLDIPP